MDRPTRLHHEITPFKELAEWFVRWMDARRDYKSYLQSPEWKTRATAAKERAGYRCQLCNRSSKQVTLNVHHRTYAHLGNETPDDLTVLCEDCHELYEEHRKKNSKRLKQESIERMLTHARRARRNGGGGWLLSEYVKELQLLELPENQYRDVREHITEILYGEEA